MLKRYAMPFSLLVVIIFMALTGVVALTLGRLISYNSVKEMLDSYSYTGGVDYITIAYYEGMIQRAGIVGIVLIGLAILMGSFFTWITKVLNNFIHHFKSDVRQLYQWICGGGEGDTMWITVVFWCVLLVAFGVRLFFMGQGVHADEARTYNAYAFRPFIILLADWTAPNNHIFHSLLARISYLLFGDSLANLRLPAFGFGMLFLPIVYLFGKQYYNRITGLLLMSFYSVSYAYVSYSVMGRGYTILFCCTYMLFIMGRALIEFPANGVVWVLAAIISVVGCWTIPTMLYSVAGVGLWLFLRKPVERSGGEGFVVWWAQLLIFAFVVGVLVALVYSPAFVATDWTLINDDSALTTYRTWVNIRLEVPNVLRQIQSTLFKSIPYWVRVAIIGLGGLGLFCRQSPNGRRGMPLIICVLFVACCIPICIQRVIPYARIYTVFFPLIVVVPLFGISCGIQRIIKSPIKQKWLAGGVGLLFVIVMGGQLLKDHADCYFKTGDHVPDAKKVALFLHDNASPSDIIVAWSPMPGPLVFYFNQLKIKHRVWDLLEYIPEFKEGDRPLWLVVNKLMGEDLSAYTERLNRTDFMERAIRVYNSYYVEIYRINGLSLYGSTQTGE